jgi:hypothetical protein
MNRLTAAGVGAVAVAAAIGYLLGHARAAGIPATAAMTYYGTVTDTTGTPVSGMKNIQLQMWNVATGGTTPVCLTTSTAMTLTAGNFQVVLPDTCTTAVHAGADLWIEVLVDGATTGRTKLGAVPFAVEAGHAASADTATTAAGATGALMTSVSALQAHDIYAFKKGGDNGTVNCTAYCTGDSWATVGNGRGTCVAAYRTDTQKYVGCDDVAPGLLASGELTCWCSQPPP